jgi:dolichyl-phosphate beta-glucosyltransferase
MPASDAEQSPFNASVAPVESSIAEAGEKDKRAAIGAALAGKQAPGRTARDASPTTATPARCYLSLIIPAYNEEKRLPATLERMMEYLALRDFSYELIVVDDGSRDATREVVRSFAARHSWIRLESYDDDEGRPLNRGKGYAVRHGVLNAWGRDILFSDADLSTPIEEMEKLLPPISRGTCDITIASRALPESNLAVHQPWYREWMGRTFNKFVQRVIETDIVDTQCGFKAFRGDVAKRIFSLAQIDGFGFDTEILFLAQKFGYRVREIPVTWQHRDDSRVSPLIAPFQMISELLQVRLNDVRGLYDEQDEPSETEGV